MGFSRKECWSGLPFPSPGDLPDPKIKPVNSINVSQWESIQFTIHTLIFFLFFRWVVFWCAPFLKPLLNLLQYRFCLLFWFIGHKAGVILALWPGIEVTPPALEGEVLTTGLPETSLPTQLMSLKVPDGQIIDDMKFTVNKPTAILYWLCISFCWGNLPGQNTRSLSEFFSAPHSVRLSSKLNPTIHCFSKTQDPHPVSSSR